MAGPCEDTAVRMRRDNLILDQWTQSDEKIVYGGTVWYGGLCIRLFLSSDPKTLRVSQRRTLPS